MKLCTRCGAEKQIGDFYTHKVGGHVYPKPMCKKCENQVTHIKLSPTNKRKHVIAANRRNRNARATLPSKPRFIRADANRYDRRRGWINNLTNDFIANLIKEGCPYCGVDVMSAKMSIDRIDNAKPHNQDNVVAACSNCNLTRGTMPYGAWLVVAKGMREAREVGLLSGWLRRG